MHAYVRRALRTALLTGGLLVAGTATAHAVSDDGGLVGDIADDVTAVVPVTAPVTVGCSAVAVVGDAGAHCSGTPATDAPYITVSDTSPTEGPGRDALIGGISNDVTAVVPVIAPVTVDGVAVSVLGDATSSSAGGTPPTAPAEVTVTDTTTDDGSSAVGNGELVGDVLTGTDVVVPVTAPISADGNAVSVIGDATTGGEASVGEAPTAPADPVTPSLPEPVLPTVPDLPPALPAAPAAPSEPGGPIDEPSDQGSSGALPPSDSVQGSGVAPGFGVGAGFGIATTSGTGAGVNDPSGSLGGDQGADTSGSFPLGGGRDALSDTGFGAVGTVALSALLLAGGAVLVGRRVLAG